MKTVIAATDFSPVAFNAVNYAADMALALEAKLVVMHVYQMPVMYLEVPVSINTEDIRRDAEREMNKLKQRISVRTGGKLFVETELRMGVFYPELKALCDELQPFAVVMGSQGSTAAERLFFGGHTVYTMKHLMWPLITVPPLAGYKTVRKIGLACDFQKVLETTPVMEIKKLVKDFKAELHILNTGHQEDYNSDVVFESGMLEEMLGEARPVYHFISGSSVDKGIMDFAEKNNIDLLVILPKRHGVIDKLIHKSVSARLVLHSHVPVMALHQ